MSIQSFFTENQVAPEHEKLFRRLLSLLIMKKAIFLQCEGDSQKAGTYIQTLGEVSGFQAALRLLGYKARLLTDFEILVTPSAAEICERFNLDAATPPTEEAPEVVTKSQETFQEWGRRVFY